jgi:hypothetical protein
VVDHHRSNCFHSGLLDFHVDHASHRWTGSWKFSTIQSKKEQGGIVRKQTFISIATAAVLLAGLSGCGGGNSAAGINTALRDYIEAQSTFNSFGGQVSESSIDREWVRKNGENITQMRSKFEVLRSEASQVDFPSSAGVRGEPSRATITEYLSAVDNYIAFNEQMQLETETCISNGETAFDCVMLTGVMNMSGAYPEVVQRAQSATLQLREESSIG